jgi:hypothetical protein
MKANVLYRNAEQIESLIKFYNEQKVKFKVKHSQYSTTFDFGKEKIKFVTQTYGIRVFAANKSLVKDIKLASSDHIKSLNLFPDFNGWQNGYGGFTYSFKDKDHLIEYVKNQEEHHKSVTFKDELVELLKEPITLLLAILSGVIPAIFAMA